MANRVNFQREMDALIEKNTREGVIPTLLLHSCCAPCSSYVIEYLSKYFKITVFTITLTCIRIMNMISVLLSRRGLSQTMTLPTLFRLSKWDLTRMNFIKNKGI